MCEMVMVVEHGCAVLTVCEMEDTMARRDGVYDKVE